MKQTLIVFLLFVLTGCAVGPNYQPIKTKMPKNWTEPVTNIAAPVTRWWKTFNDSQLDTLIERAVKQNYDLRMASARLREARALYGVAVSALGPNITGNSSYTKARTSKNSLNFPITDLDTDTYQVGFDAQWEIDVFGGRRRKIEAGRASVEASREDRRDVLVSLLAEVARNYVELRSLQRRRVIARENIAAQSATLELIQKLFDVGTSSKLDVIQATALLAGMQSQLPILEIALKQTRHRLEVLLGQQPGTLMTELASPAPIPLTPPDVPVGLPSDLLRRRPDVRRSERQLASATARIGVETAELFPKFSLGGLTGFQSLSANNWFSSDSRFWSVGPILSWRLLQFGAIRNQIHAANAREEQALALYEKTVITSLEEVENALVAYTQEKIRHRLLQEQVNANKQAVELSTQLYTQGQSSFLNVLDSQRSLYETEDALVRSESAVTTHLITLYKALGGGWEENL